MSGGARWSAVVLVLAVAAVVALWPRDSGESPGPQPRPTKDVLVARGEAALRPCPEGEGGPEPLRGVTAVCAGDGETVDVASTLPGKALVNFWATWCVPCQEELKVLDAYSRQPGASPVLAVQVRSKEDDGLELLAKLGVHLPTVFDGTEAVQKAVRLPANRLPVSYLVGEDGSLTEITRPLYFTSVDQVREVVG